MSARDGGFGRYLRPEYEATAEATSKAAHERRVAERHEVDTLAAAKRAAREHAETLDADKRRHNEGGANRSNARDAIEKAGRGFGRYLHG